MRPSRGWGLASLLGFFPFPEQLPRELVHPSVEVSGPGCLESLLFSECREGEVPGDELRLPLCVPCSAPPEIPQHPWARTPQIPASRCHGRCPHSSHASRVLLLPDWDEPEATEKPPRGEILSSALKGKSRMSFVCTPWEWGSRGISRRRPHFGAGPLWGGVMIPRMG